MSEYHNIGFTAKGTQEDVEQLAELIAKEHNIFLDRWPPPNGEASLPIFPSTK
jgi:hypothetical protein